MLAAMLLLLAAAGCLAPDPPAADSCTSCHGTDEDGPAPPVALGGIDDPDYRGVGAHQAHLQPALSEPIACTECHVVPAGVDDAGHLYGNDDDTPLAEVGWSEAELANVAGAEPYDAETGSCTVYCHHAGDPAYGGSRTTIVFTEPGVSCTTCHGSPPPRPHPANDNCSGCHGSAASATPPTHLDGIPNCEDAPPNDGPNDPLVDCRE
jgi:hypothetical protein